MFFDPDYDERFLNYISTIKHSMIVGVTSGTFDLFHMLHLRYLEQCMSKCDFLIVGVDSDILVQSRKGSERPIIPEHERVSIVEAIRGVNGAFLMRSYEQFWSFIRQVEPHLIFKNKPFNFDHGAKVELIPDLEDGTCTTAIIKRIRGVVHKANVA